MSIERVRKYLQQFGRGDDIIETAASSATVELAAAALGIEPARIAKTLSFMAKSGVILIVAAGDCKIDNRKYKELFGCKAKILSLDEVLQYKKNHMEVRVYVDNHADFSNSATNWLSKNILHKFYSMKME